MISWLDKTRSCSLRSILMHPRCLLLMNGTIPVSCIAYMLAPVIYSALEHSLVLAHCVCLLTGQTFVLELLAFRPLSFVFVFCLQ
ncbi:hypothetical protein DEU56DRAFT_50645 [Suillus clintonianus]|uniref:uncharacterized protein n=1 Tax=Suillus clintonianus TaxID=1904413 RepID=UPI001B860E0F|nr:uncharacterized protein DEU56DRAFT_50645 [Suillus clintonianus]KAG2123419.1 hypothetical protein DEU56DRAFT_50645 [Suillus clintonianus]